MSLAGSWGSLLAFVAYIASGQRWASGLHGVPSQVWPGLEGPAPSSGLSAPPQPRLLLGEPPLLPGPRVRLDTPSPG